MPRRRSICYASVKPTRKPKHFPPPMNPPKPVPALLPPTPANP